MKTFLLSPFLVFIITISLACNKDNELIPQSKEISNRSGSFKGKLHRAKVLTQSGRTCGCEACFGLCNFRWEEDEETINDGSFKVSFKKVGSTTYLYFLESFSHSESDFVVDYDLAIYVDEGGSLVQRTLSSNTYSFQSSGYVTPAGMGTTYGRVQVITY